MAHARSDAISRLYLIVLALRDSDAAAFEEYPVFITVVIVAVKVGFFGIL